MPTDLTEIAKKTGGVAVRVRTAPSRGHVAATLSMLDRQVDAKERSAPGAASAGSDSAAGDTKPALDALCQLVRLLGRQAAAEFWDATTASSAPGGRK